MQKIKPGDSERRERARDLVRAGRVLGRAGRAQSEVDLAQEALRLHTSESMQRALYWAAIRNFDVGLAQDTVRSLQEQAGQDPEKLAWLERIKAGPLSLVALTEKLTERHETAFEPVPDRVAYIMHNTLPYSSGGYATRGHGMALGLQAAGLDVQCISRPGFPGDLQTAENAHLPRPEEDLVDGVNYRRIFEPFRRGHQPAEYMELAAEKLIPVLRQMRPACVLAASNHATALPACLAARKLGIPFIYEIRGFWEITRISREPEFVQTPAFKMQKYYEEKTAQSSDAVITLTTPMVEELIARGVESAKITLAPNSCDPSRFTPRARDAGLAARYNIPQNVPVIGYIGTFVQYEGLEHLTQACAMLKQKNIEFRLLIVGNENASGTDRGPITQEILRIAEEAGLEDWLLMPGRIPHEEVEAHYSLVDVAPFPRKPQPVTEMVSPMKPLEALAMEKAVVVSSVRALTEMIEDGVTGMVFEKGKVDSLADTLERLLQDAELRARLGRAGRKWVETERSWEKTAHVVADVIRRTAARG